MKIINNTSLGLNLDKKARLNVYSTSTRSVTELLAPLNQLVESHPGFLSHQPLKLMQDGQVTELPRYIFLGAKPGEETLRIGLFAGIHGDEPEGVRALVQFLSLLASHPEIATGYCLYVYPVCNPKGFEANTRWAASGHDLNREFWQNSTDPEVALLEQELRTQNFQGLISLHTDDTSHGLYGFVRGATLAKHLLKPALQAAEDLLPRNYNASIDGFHARESIITDCYPGVLSAPPKSRPQPFEVILETPQTAPEFLKEKALVLATQTILAEYRKFIAIAQGI
jgi:hypothetical protein